MSKIFCVPFNGDFDFCLAYAREHRDAIHEFYGSDGEFLAGRYTNRVPLDELGAFVKELGELGIGFNYLLNAISVEPLIEDQKHLLDHLARLRSFGVSAVTLTHPHLVKAVKELGFSVSTSLVQNVRERADVAWAQAFGYDRIICSDDLNRQVGRLKNLLDVAQVPVELIANNMCMPSCPLRQTHYSFDGLLNVSEEERARYIGMKRSIVLCRGMWKDDPAIFLKSGWMRPQDVQRYLDLGVSYIKLAGRDFASPVLKQVLDLYLAGSHEGGVFDFLRPLTDPMEKYGLENVRADALDEFFDFFFDGDGCQGFCDECHHCDTYAKQVFGR